MWIVFNTRDGLVETYAEYEEAKKVYDKWCEIEMGEIYGFTEEELAESDGDFIYLYKASTIEKFNLYNLEHSEVPE